MNYDPMDGFNNLHYVFMSSKCAQKLKISDKISIFNIGLKLDS